MPELSILLSTIDDRIYQAEKLFSAAGDTTEFVVVHQVTNPLKADSYHDLYLKYQAHNCRFFQRLEKGTGKSRNLALQQARGNYFYICDDDILLLPDALKIFSECGKKYPDADIFTFMVQDENGNPYKHYFSEKRWLSLNDCAKVSNVEMLIRKTWYEKNPVQFDERFGLGTVFNTGEEFVFLAEALKKNARILFLPAYVAVHPKDSSGKRYEKDLIEAKGAMIARVYGWKYWLINFAFAVRKFTEYRKRISFFSFVRHIYRGSFKFYRQ